MYGYWRKPDVSPTAYGQAAQQSELYSLKTSAVTKAFAQEATVGVGTLRADIEARKVKEAEEYGYKITEDEYKNNPEIYSEGVSWYDGMTIESAVIAKEFDDAARKRASIIADASTGQAALGFAVGFGAGVIEPKNLAVGVAASLATGGLAEVGVLGNTMRRLYQARKTALKARVGVGAAEGVAAGVAIEPSNRYSAKTLQQDYTMADSLFNIATSTAFGAGLPVATNALSKASPFMRAKMDKFRGRTMDVVAAEHDLALQQFTQGQRVDVSVVEAAEIGSKSSPVIGTQEFAAAFEGSKAVAADGAPIKFYRGSGYAEQNPNAEAIFLTDNPANASTYARGEAPNVEPTYPVAKNPLVVDAAGKTWGEIQFEGKKVTTNDMVRIAKERGHDSVRFDNVIDRGPAGRFSSPEANKPATTLAVFSKEQLLPAYAQKDNAATIQKHNTATIDPKNDTLIDYDAIDAADERRAIQQVEGQAEAEAYLKDAEAEIQLMLEQDVLNDADLAEYQAAIEELNSSDTKDALDILHICLTRG